MACEFPVAVKSEVDAKLLYTVYFTLLTICRTVLILRGLDDNCNVLTGFPLSWLQQFPGLFHYFLGPLKHFSRTLL